MPLQAAPAERLECGNCGGPMHRLVLDGHYGRRVEIDRCAPCHLVWFDSLESVRLSGTGMLALLGDMAESHREPHRVLRANARCPRCGGPLRIIENRSRWGPTRQLECGRRHGAYQTFAQFLSEKGLVRTLGPADRASLLAHDPALACLNCGAALGRRDEHCRYCASVPGLVDVARLAQALDPEGVTASHPVHVTRIRRAALQCLACGAPLRRDLTVRCEQCGATLAISQLAQAHAAVSALEAGLRAHARSPAPHVRARRLAALDADLGRRREWVRTMEVEAGASRSAADDGAFWDDLRQRPWGVALAVGLLFLVWKLFWG